MYSNPLSFVIAFSFLHRLSDLGPCQCHLHNWLLYRVNRGLMHGIARWIDLRKIAQIGARSEGLPLKVAWCWQVTFERKLAIWPFNSCDRYLVTAKSAAWKTKILSPAVCSRLKRDCIQMKRTQVQFEKALKSISLPLLEHALSVLALIGNNKDVTGLSQMNHINLRALFSLIFRSPICSNEESAAMWQKMPSRWKPHA